MPESLAFSEFGKRILGIGEPEAAPNRSLIRSIHAFTRNPQCLLNSRR